MRVLYRSTVRADDISTLAAALNARADSLTPQNPTPPDPPGLQTAQPSVYQTAPNILETAVAQLSNNSGPRQRLRFIERTSKGWLRTSHDELRKRRVM
jgi:hypothetical protein